MTDVSRFLERTTDHQARFYDEALVDMFTGYVLGDRVLMSGGRARLTDAILEAMRFGEIVGASTVLQGAAGAYEGNPPIGFGAAREYESLLRFSQEPTNSILPRVTFEEAVQDLVDRTPVALRRAADRTAQRIAELYTQSRVVSFVQSAERAVTEAAQRSIVEAMRSGINEGEAGRRLSMQANEVRTRGRKWTEGYARMAFRTNVNTAVAAGRFRQAQDQAVRDVAPAFRFSSAGDADTRHNHDALDGVILRVDNPEWRRIAPPLGYNCRCQIELVSIPQLMRMGRFKDGQVVESRVPSAGRPDDGFRHGGRPDLAGLLT